MLGPRVVHVLLVEERVVPAYDVAPGGRAQAPGREGLAGPQRPYLVKDLALHEIAGALDPAVPEYHMGAVGMDLPAGVGDIEVLGLEPPAAQESGLRDIGVRLLELFNPPRGHEAVVVHLTEELRVSGVLPEPVRGATEPVVRRVVDYLFDGGVALELLQYAARVITGGVVPDRYLRARRYRLAEPGKGEPGIGGPVVGYHQYPCLHQTFLLTSFRASFTSGTFRTLEANTRYVAMPVTISAMRTYSMSRLKEIHIRFDPASERALNMESILMPIRPLAKYWPTKKTGTVTAM